MTEMHASPARFAGVLSVAVIGLVLASTAGQIAQYVFDRGSVFGLVNLFSLDREANLPTWFSSTALFICAGLLGIIAAEERRRQTRWRHHWLALAAIFLMLSVDEAASIHELSIGPVRELVGASGFFHWAWVIPGALFVLVVGVIYLRFMLALPRSTRRLFVLSACLYVGGALLVEMMGAQWFSEFGRRNLGYVLFWTIEETGEMMGVVTFMFALMTYLRDEVGSVTLQFAGRAAPEAQLAAQDPGDYRGSTL